MERYFDGKISGVPQDSLLGLLLSKIFLGGLYLLSPNILIANFAEKSSPFCPRMQTTMF